MKFHYQLNKGAEIHAHKRGMNFNVGHECWETFQSVRPCLYTVDEFLHTAKEVESNLAVVRQHPEYKMENSGLHNLDVMLKDRVYVNLWNYPHSEYDGFLVNVNLLRKYEV